MKKDKNIISKIIIAITLCTIIIETGITISFYMLTKMDLNMFNNNENNIIK